jgi:hypothetical protein
VIFSILAVTIVMAVVMLVAWATQRGLKNGGWTDVQRQVRKQPLFEKSGAKTFLMLGQGRWR